MEACETYSKQSWRNRCRILSANGPLDLNVPVVHEGGSFHIPIKQIKVEYTTPWVVRTERAIESAYSSAPYFNHYRDGVFAILDSHPETLWELNLRIIRFFCEKTGIAPDIRFTTEFAAVPEGPQEDFRTAIHPKKPNTIMRDLGLERPYWQVFGERFGFTPGLSIMDLLFNEGPESPEYLR